MSPALVKVALPDASPESATVTALLKDPADPVTLPVTSPVKPEFAVIVVPVIAAGLLAPIVAPSMAPPSISTLLSACTAKLPRPRFVLAPAAVSAPVPPCASGSWLFVSIKFESLKDILPTDAVPEEKETIPVEDELSPPKPPY